MVEDEIRRKMEECDLVLVYPDNFITKILMFIVKMIFPGVEYSPFAPVFGYRGKIYGKEEDRNLAEILVKQEYNKACVINSSLKWNKNRTRDFVRVMREYRSFWVILKYLITGVVGVLTNMVLFFVLFQLFEFPDIPSLIAAIELSIILTFFMNNCWVFSNRVYSRSIWWRMGAYHFTLVMGIVINVGTYWILSRLGVHYMLADFVGIVFASLWNFYLTNAHVFFSKYQKPA